MRTEVLGATVLVCMAMIIATTAMVGCVLVFSAASSGFGVTCAIVGLTIFGILAEMAILNRLFDAKPGIRPPVQVPDAWPPGREK